MGEQRAVLADASRTDAPLRRSLSYPRCLLSSNPMRRIGHRDNLTVILDDSGSRAARAPAAATLCALYCGKPGYHRG